MAKKAQTPPDNADPNLDPAAQDESLAPGTDQGAEGENLQPDGTEADPAAQDGVPIAPAELDGPQALPRRLSVTRTFQGAASGENPVTPGTYYEIDPELHGLAEWLVANGYAFFL